MTTDIVEINNYIVLIEQSNNDRAIVESCDLDDNVIGFSFYGSGEVELKIKYSSKETILQNKTGMATSFFGNGKVSFKHYISSKKPLRSVSIFSTIKNLHKLPKQEIEIYKNYLNKLFQPTTDFVEGPSFYMTPDMQNAIDKIFKTTYSGTARMLFLKSQITELLAHFFAMLTSKTTKKIDLDEEKLYQAKKILSNNMEAPPSLNELSKLIGLNSFKLKKNFKELFGIPVFKYLQIERLNKAHELLSSSEMNIQEVAYFVGYESLGSFSNAFFKKFGIRPSELKK